MRHAEFIVFYVDQPTKSAKFYSELLLQEPVESSETFIVFTLSSSLKLGLWSKHTVNPPSGLPGGAELSFAVDNNEEVNHLHQQWQQWKLPVELAPTELECGYNFVGLDPDGHRLRFYVAESE